MGRRKWRQRNVPELKSEHAAKRLAWAMEYEHFTPQDWARVKWSDECMVERGNGIRPIWTFRRPKDQLQEHDVHEKPYGSKVKQMFWAAFGERYRIGLVPVDGGPDSARGGITS
jgi:hypothetical protein